MNEPNAAAAPAAGAPPRLRAEWGATTIVVLILFLMSGASGLIYEVVWTRMLTYIFGATIYAVTTVLAAFMGGLALGSWLIGGYADRSRNPLRLYAWLELAIAVSAALLPVLFAACDPLYRQMYLHLPQSFGVYSLCRFALTFALLLVPTTCMGATLPVLSRWSARSQDVLGVSLGRLYAVNTFGAVAGCFGAGFIGIAALGVTGTLYVAVGLNAAVFLIAVILAQQETPPPEEEEARDKTPAPGPSIVQENITPMLRKLVFWFYGGSGLVALVYQVVWFRSLVFSFADLKNTTYAFTAMLTVFLVGLATGSAVGSRIVDTLSHPVRCFALVQAAIGIGGAFSFFLIFYRAPAWEPFLAIDDQQNFHFYRAVANMLFKTGGSIFIPTFLMGLAYPVAVRVLVSVQGAGKKVGQLYAINTVGAIVGSLIGGFVLIPLLGLAYTIFVMALINLVFALVLMYHLEEYSPQTRNIMAGVFVVALGVIWWRMGAETHFQKAALDPKLERIVVDSQTGESVYREGPLATVAVVENSMMVRDIKIDNVSVAGTDRIMLTDQKSLAHVPMLFLDNPKVALTVGFGSGGASWSYLRHPSLERLDCLEICRSVLEMAPFLKASNHGVLDEPRDPRFNIIIDDVRSYLRFTDQQYDIIATDCTDLRYKTNANLYDREYFELCRDRLTSQGMVVVWMPLGGLSDEAFRVALRTFAHVFPNMTIWYMNNEPTHYILLLGTREDFNWKIDYARMEKKLKQPDVKKDLAELYLDDPLKLLSCFVTDARALGKTLEGDLLNTENRPFLEFASPRYGYGNQPLFDNLDLLLKHRGDVADYLAPASVTPELRAQLTQYAAAVEHIISGHVHYRKNEIASACQAYLKAAELTPADASVKYLLEFREIELKAALQHSPWAELMMAEVLRLTGHPEEAISYYNAGLGRFQQAASGLTGQPLLLNQRIIAEGLLGMCDCLIEKKYLKRLPQLFEAAEKIVETYPELKDLQSRVEALKKRLPKEEPKPEKKEAPPAAKEKTP